MFRCITTVDVEDNRLSEVVGETRDCDYGVLVESIFADFLF
jgi:hypothetical protein